MKAFGEVMGLHVWKLQTINNRLDNAILELC